MIISLLATLLLGQQTIPSIPVPPADEPTILFVHYGRLFQVHKTSNKVVVYEAGVPPQPIPPQPVPPEPKPPEPQPDLQGFQRAVYDAYMAVPLEDRKQTARDLGFCIDVVLAKAGGLSLNSQQIVDELASVIRLKGLDKKLVGFKLGDLLSAQGSDRETIIRALNDVRKAMGVFG